MKRIFYLFFLVLGIYGYSANIYVATTGSNSNSGTISSPYKTIAYAAGVANPGDIVWVRGGTYTNANYANGSKWNSENAVRISCNGTSTQYITFQAYPGEVAKIKFDGNYGILIQSSSYVKIIGFEVEGMNASITLDEAWGAWGLYTNPNETVTPIHDLAVELGINPKTQPIGSTVTKAGFTFNETRPSYYNGRGIVANKSHHIEILNNKVYNCPSSGIRADVCDYITVSGNEVFNNTLYTSQGVGAITFSGSINIIDTTVPAYNDTSTGVKMIIENNNVYDNENRLVSWNGAKTEIKFEIDEGSGIFLTRNNDELVPIEQRYNYGYFLIRNNLSYRNGASGIVVHKTDKTYVEFNTVYKNGTSNTGFPGGIGINDTNNVVIRNNISYAKPDKFAIGIVGGTNSNLSVSSNLLYNENGTQSIINKIDNSNIINLTVINNGLRISNPLLANPSASTPDFRLQNTSVAINAGTASAFTINDYASYSRDSQPDIGAYEYVAGLDVKEASLNQLKIYPNPAHDLLNISGLQNNKEVKIYSMDGKDVSRLVKLFFIPNNQLQLDVSKLPPGVYIIKSPHQEVRLLKN